jgi:hypothetical protein
MLIRHACFQKCDALFQCADVTASRSARNRPNGLSMPANCGLHTGTSRQDTEAEQFSHMRMRCQPFHRTCSRVECHHTGKHTVRISNITLSQRGETLTRCLRRLHLLHARFTRDFRDADVDVVGGLSIVDVVHEAFCPCCSSEASGNDDTASEATDNLLRLEDELPWPVE